MATREYAIKHRLLGLCIKCPNDLIDGSTIYCKYHREKARENRRLSDKKIAIALKSECLAHYGKSCSCCGEDHIEFLTIDHIKGRGNLHRRTLFKHNVGGVHMYRWLKRNNFPTGYRILCMNCNWAKRYSNVCPHKIRRGRIVA